MRILVTGSAGFLGWHTRVRLDVTTSHEVVAVDRDEWSQLDELIAGADAVLHLAGINRADDDEVRDGNIRIAQDLGRALSRASSVRSVVYANTVHAGNGTPYGTGKERAAEVLRSASAARGATFTDVVLPNLFGEHGRPNYNSFVATFVHAVVGGQTPQVEDRDVELLHVQDAAQALIDAISGDGGSTHPQGTATTVAGVLDTFREQFDCYRSGEIPELRTDLDLRLFNTLRAAMFPDHYPMPLTWRTDERGELVEVVRARGSAGQTFLSHTRPGATRGNHFHLRKMERFAVVAGTARITLRRALTDEVVVFDVAGDSPVVVDMPTGWVHAITNTGDSDLTTAFWTSELYDPDDADTYPMLV